MKRQWLVIPVLTALVAAACAPAAPPPPPPPTAAPAKPAAPAAKPAPAPEKPAAPAAKPAPAKPKPPEVTFAGKTIRFVVGFAAGGGYDTYTRAIARHIGKHLPGNPTTIVENMAGGGSLVAANSLAKKAKPDGLTVGVFNSNQILQVALGAKGPQFKGNEFGWVGAPSTGQPTCTFMGFTGVKTWQDVVASGKEYKMGATAVGSTTGDLPRILGVATPAKFKMVEGYDGTSKIRLALEAKEVDGACWGWESISVTARAMLDAEGDGKLIPVAFEGRSQDKEVKDLPRITSLIKDADHLSMFKAWLGPYEFQRPLALPPETPKEVVSVFRKAFLETMKDAEFLAETKKAKLELDPVSGEEIDKAVANVLAVTPKAKEGLQFLLVQ